MKRLLIVLLIFITLAGLFIAYLAFEWRADVSTDLRFAPYLNCPIVLKDTATLAWLKDENQTRFKSYSLNYGEYSFYNTSEMKSVKHYLPGDTIWFREAWTHTSIFVGTTPYLIGREMLEPGEEIEFEYYASFDHFPAVWETVEEFVERRERERAVEGDQ